MKKMILSCDTGVDDALALAYAAGQQQMEFIGVAATFGVASVQNTYRNSKHVLKLLGCDAKVWMGSEFPLSRPGFDYESREGMFHGNDGLGDILGQAVPEDLADAIPGEAVDRIIENVHRYGKDLVIVTTGAMTDLARALQKDPSIAEEVGAVVSMVGALAAPGNATQFAEANARMDPEAAKLVFASSLPLTVIGLDVTRKTLLCGDDLARWQAIPTEAARQFSACVGTYLEAYRKRYPYLAGCALHDPLAVGVAMHPDWVTTIPMHLTCITEGEADGRTCEDLDRVAEKDFTTLGAFLVDSDAFEKEFFELVEMQLTGKKEA